MSDPADSPSRNPEQLPPSGRDILLVEDDDAVRKALEHILLRAGMSVVSVGSGREALALIEKRRFACLVTDILMAEIEGLELIRTVKTRQPEMKIVAISGGGRSSPSTYLKMARLLGADRTLEKPFGAEQLVEAVKFAST
jgi:DNA-binding NtrC family response regulator